MFELSIHAKVSNVKDIPLTVTGFLYSFLKGFDLEKSCKIGNWVASKSIEGFGMDKFPSLKDLEEFF